MTQGVWRHRCHLPGTGILLEPPLLYFLHPCCLASEKGHPDLSSQLGNSPPGQRLPSWCLPPVFSLPFRHQGNPLPYAANLGHVVLAPSLGSHIKSSCLVLRGSTQGFGFKLFSPVFSWILLQPAHNRRPCLVLHWGG